jgi:hypothetical protein
MGGSKRFSQLAERLKTIRLHFLPEEFSSLGDYDERVLDHARAFILLAHAELESYLEDCATDQVNTAHERWKKYRSCPTLLSRLVFYHLAKTAKNRDWAMPSDKSINAAVNAYKRELNDNHGIKEQNVLSILLPLGLAHDKLSTTLLGTLNSLGTIRGNVAHRSVKAHQSIDPKTVCDNVFVNRPHNDSDTSNTTQSKSKPLPVNPAGRDSCRIPSRTAPYAPVPAAPPSPWKSRSRPRGHPPPVS